MTPSLGRDPHRLRPPRRGGELSRRHLVGDLPDEPQRQVARRRAGDGRGRDLVLQQVQGAQPQPRPVLRQRHQRRGDRARRGDLHLRPTGNRELPKILGQLICLCPSTGGRAPTPSGKQRDIGAPTLEPPLGSGPYAIGELHRRPHHHLRARARLLGRQPPDPGRPQQFRRRSATSTSSISTCSSRPSRPTRSTSGSRTRPRAGPLPTTSPPSRTAGSSRSCSPTTTATRLDGGLGPNLRKPIFQNEKLREALNYAFDFEELNRTLFYGQYERINSYFFGLPVHASVNRPAAGRGARDPQVASRTWCPRRSSPTEYKNPVSRRSDKAPRQLPHRARALRRGGLHPRRQPAGRRQRPAARLRDPAQRSDQEPQMPRPTRRTCEALGIDGHDPCCRLAAIHRAHARLRFRRRSTSAWAQSLDARQRAALLLGYGVGQRGRLAQLPRHHRSGHRRAHRQDHLRRRPRDARSRDRARSTACCWPTTTSCRATRSATRRVARWDRFSHPEPLPEYASGFPTIWWWDEAKAAKTGRERRRSRSLDRDPPVDDEVGPRRISALVAREINREMRHLVRLRHAAHRLARDEGLPRLVVVRRSRRARSCSEGESTLPGHIEFARIPAFM